jgi:hypothetical protein
METTNKGEILELCKGVEGMLREATCPEETEVKGRSMLH